MKTFIGLCIIGGLFLPGCEEDPEIQVPGFRTEPVVHCIIDTSDSIHYIRIGRMYSGVKPPHLTGAVSDSIYFDSVGVKVTLTRLNGRKTEITVDSLVRFGKEEGYFNSDEYAVYCFYQQMEPYYSIHLEISVPDLPVARCSTLLVQPPRMYSPKRAQQFLFFYPDNPVRIQWYGGKWNEIDMAFRVMEQYADSTVVQTFHYQKSTDFIIQEENPITRYCELKIPYEILIKLIKENLDYRADVIKRYFGKVDILIHTGNEDFEIYQRFLGGSNDFNFTPYNNIENGIGILSSKSTTQKTGMRLDDMSRAKLASDPELARFRFIEY